MAKKDGAKGAVGLEITSEDVEPCQVRLTVVVSAERVQREMDVVAQAYARHLRVPGYRPGKVPTQLVIAQVGEEELREAAHEQLLEKVVREAVRSQGLTPSAPTLVEDQRHDPLTFVLLVPLAPEVNLGEYHALRVPEPEPEVATDEDVAEILENLRQSVAHLETVDRPAEEGDLVIVSLLGRLADKIVVEEESVGLTLTAAGASEQRLPPGIVEHLIGMSAGEERSFAFTYSEFWPQPELQAQEVAFEATVESVSGSILPALDDAFAQEVSEAETVAELEGLVVRSLAARRRQASRNEWLDQAVAALIAAAEVRYPPQLLEAEIDEAVDGLRQRVERQGFTWQRWLELQEKDEDALRAEFEAEAARRLKGSLVLSEFARAEGIEVTRADVESALRSQQESLVGTGLRLRRTDAVRHRMSNELLTGRALSRLLETVSGKGDEGGGTVGMLDPADGASADGAGNEDKIAADAASEDGDAEDGIG